MNSLFATALAFLATVAYAAPSGHETILVGTSGVVTEDGAIGLVGHNWGNGCGVALWAPTVIATPIVAHNSVEGISRLGYGQGAINGRGMDNGYGAINSWGPGYGSAAFTAGHGSISATEHGALIRGPPTAPVVIAGQTGKTFADGLWGPTDNVCGHGLYGSVGHVGYAQGHGWW